MAKKRTVIHPGLLREIREHSRKPAKKRKKSAASSAAIGAFIRKLITFGLGFSAGYGFTKQLGLLSAAGPATGSTAAQTPTQILANAGALRQPTLAPLGVPTQSGGPTATSPVVPVSKAAVAPTTTTTHPRLTLRF